MTDNDNPSFTAKDDTHFQQQWLGGRPFLLFQLDPDDLDSSGDPQITIEVGGMPDVEHDTVGGFCAVVEAMVRAFARQLLGDEYDDPKEPTA